MLNNISVKFYGGSHEEKIGVVITGFPKGKKIDLDALKTHMERRKPKHAFSTNRKETDEVEVVSGITAGVTNGDRLEFCIKNTDKKTEDYDKIAVVPRPSHADYVSFVKYGKIQPGGGEFSGRMTALITLLGGIAEQELQERGVKIVAYVSSIGGVKGASYRQREVTDLDVERIKNSSFPLLDEKFQNEMTAVINSAKESGDSVGGTVECVVLGLKCGIGGSLYDGLEGVLSKALFAIPAVKGVEFGDGFSLSESFGSSVADEFYFDGKTVKTYTNRNGGINGGVSNGMPILTRVAFKPAPSIKKPMRSVDLITGEPKEISVSGRHDACFVPRASVVVESAVAWEIFKELSEETL